MKNILSPTPFIILLFLLLGCGSQGKLRQPEAASDPLVALQAQIDQILADSVLLRTRTGLKVVSLQSGETLYARDSRYLYNPASNMKLLTTAAALKRLGPDFRYQTTLWADSAAVQDSIISGDIYLKGSGDPDLLRDGLRRLTGQLKALGIRRIAGDLRCDESYMDDLYWGSGWMWDDVSGWYWAPISALTVEDNCVTVTVTPGEAAGDPLEVSIDPPTAYMQIDNRGRTAAPMDSASLKAYKVERVWRPVAKNVVAVEGGLSLDAAPRRYTIDVVDAALYTGALMQELLREEGITIAGTVQQGIVPENARLLAEHRSPPLTEIVLNTNKISDNLSAELLLKTVGAAVKGAPGTAAKGISVIYQMLDELGVDSTGYRLADGSGVSRYDLITPDLVIELLKEMHRDFRVQAEYQASLPIAGLDGSLKYRMRDTAAANKLRAKTGTLSGVSALAGYTTTADGEQLAFSMVMEHFVGSSSAIRKIQDRIGAVISGFSRK